MRRSLTLALAAACIFCCARAKADSIFQIDNGTTGMGGTYYGNMTINTTYGFVSAADIFYTGGLAGSSTIELQYITGQQANFGNGPEYALVVHDTPIGMSYVWEVDLDFKPPTLVHYAGSTLCTLSSPCNGDYTALFHFKGVSNDSYDSLKTGSVSAVATTPEPSSLALLATGVFGMIGAAYRRYA